MSPDEHLNRLLARGPIFKNGGKATRKGPYVDPLEQERVNVALTALLPGNTPPWCVPTGTPSSLHPQVMPNRVPGTPVSHHFDHYRYFHDIPQVLPSCSDEAPEPVRPAPAVQQRPPIVLPAVPQGPPIILPAVPQGPPIILNESVQESVDRKTHREIKHVVALSRTPHSVPRSSPSFKFRFPRRCRWP